MGLKNSECFDTVCWCHDPMGQNNARISLPVQYGPTLTFHLPHGRVHQTGGNRSGLTGVTGPAQFRFGSVPNWLKFKIQIWIKKMKNFQKIP